MALARQGNIHVSWFEPRHLPQVLPLERSCFKNPWSEADFRSTLRERNVVGLMAEIGDRDLLRGPLPAVGYLIYELNEPGLDIVSLAVDPWHRCCGIGRLMVEVLGKKLLKRRFDRVRMVVRESDLPTQLFFRRLGFKAVVVERRYFPDTGEDGYRFELAAKVKTSGDVSLANG